MLAFFKQALEMLVTLALFTGLRQGELLGLTWDCVKSGSITVNKQLTRPELRGDLFASPKNGKTRIITIAPFAIKVLKEQKRRQAEMQIKAGPAWDNSNNLVFTDGMGGPLNYRLVDRAFSRLTHKAGLEGVRFHDLRHTFATHCLQCGVSMKVLQLWLGHASFETTASIYTHVVDAFQRTEASKIAWF